MDSPKIGNPISNKVEPMDNKPQSPESIESKPIHVESIANKEEESYAN